MSIYYHQFEIFLTDPEQCATAQAAYPDGIVDAPADVAATYGIPVVNDFEGSCVWANPTTELAVDVDSVVVPPNMIPDSVDSFRAYAGAPGGTMLWRGTFLRRGGLGEVGQEALQTHRWMVGFERANGGDGLTGGAASQRMNRDASRTLDGMGLAMRSPANEVVTMTLPSTGTGFPTKYSWERIYVRLRKYPTVSEMIWGALGSAQAGLAVLLHVTPGGQLTLYNKGNQLHPGTTITGGSGGQLPLNQWVKIDLVINFSSLASGGSGNGSIRAYVNGGFACSIAGSGPGAPVVGGAGGLLNTVQNHTSSSIGEQVTPTPGGIEIDYDDWTNKTQPQLFTGLDWTLGTHIYPLRVTGFDASHSAGWTGDYRTLDGTPVNKQLDFLTTSLASQTIAVTTDYQDRQSGCSGIQISVYNDQGGALPEQLGISLDGAAPTLVDIDTGTDAWSVPSGTTRSQVLYSAGGQNEPLTLNTVGLQYVRDAAATLRRIHLLYGGAEYIGVWGAEDPIDLSNPNEFPPRQGPHNSPYYDSVFGQNAVTFGTGQVEVMAGTYTGNGTGQDITVQMPAHWIWIRPLTLGTGGSRWWSSVLAGHDPLTETPNKGNLVRAFQSSNSPELSSSYKFSVSGTNANSNDTGVVYQYVAFSDRAMRFLLNGAYLTASATASFTHPLFNENFLPECGFLLPELGTAASTKGMYFKGTGHATNAASLMDAIESATVCAFGEGSLTPKTIINLQSSQTAYSLWRSTDGDGITAGIAITNYTGDGTGARNIALSLNGCRPLFAIVQPHNAVAYQRDPSHTGSDSTPINSPTASTTAITAGTVNQITVGATLNANGIVYSVFALPAQVGGSGWGDNPADPLPITDPIPPVEEPLPPTSNNGWWSSASQFTGAADIITMPRTPKDARDWQKINIFATGNAGYFAGFPTPGVMVNNFFIYAGNDYNVGGSQPTIRIFDGQADRLMITVPDVSGVKAIAIIAMLVVGSKIYFTTLDSGTSASDWAGRVFEFDPDSLLLKQLGTQFTTGNVPYALAWHMGRLWLGGNKGSGDISSVYFFRPDIDTAWTTDRTLTADGVGGVTSMASYQGKLYVGCNATAAMGTNKILVRDSLGAWSTSYTAVAAGTFRASNGFPYMQVFNDKLYASYWNPDTVPDSYIEQLNGTTGAWTTVYTGTGVTLRPFTGMYENKKTLFIVGGGSGLTAALVSTPDGATWTGLTAFLTGPMTTVTAMPIVARIGS